MNDQQIQNLVDYLQSIQITPAQSQSSWPSTSRRCASSKNADGSPRTRRTVTDGERCSTSATTTASPAVRTRAAAATPRAGRTATRPPTGRRYGPGLANGDTLRQLPGRRPGATNQIDFVCTGSESASSTARNGQGTGRMPGFCSVPADVDDPNTTGEVGVDARDATDPIKVGGQMTHADVEKIVAYERGL